MNFALTLAICARCTSSIPDVARYVAKCQWHLFSKDRSGAISYINQINESPIVFILDHIEYKIKGSLTFHKTFIFDSFIPAIFSTAPRTMTNAADIFPYKEVIIVNILPI